jgi:hypothetical protein
MARSAGEWSACAAVAADPIAPVIRLLLGLWVCAIEELRQVSSVSRVLEFSLP